MGMQEAEGITGTAESRQRQQKIHRGHDITVKTIKMPLFSYANLKLISERAGSTDPPLDALTVRSYIGSAMTQFLGIAGSAISIDILKVEGAECWIRVPREDMSPVLAAVGGWIGGSATEARAGWMVTASGNWLGVLVAQGQASHIWDE